jgi:hypothetical protein
MAAGDRSPLILLRQRKPLLPGRPEIPLLITFGLDLMLEEPAVKKDVWDDLKKFMPLLPAGRRS